MYYYSKDGEFLDGNVIINQFYFKIMRFSVSNKFSEAVCGR
jgi:hypothetical protein